MNKQEAIEVLRNDIEVMEAYIHGKAIQGKAKEYGDNRWIDCKTLEQRIPEIETKGWVLHKGWVLQFDFINYNYRIKPV